VWRALPLLLVVTSASATAGAREVDVAGAVALFREGREEARRGNHAAACPKFRASYALDPAIGTLLNIADCAEREGHLVAALRRFEDGLAQLAPTDRRVDYVRSRIEALARRVPRIVGTLGAGQRLFVDGGEVAVLPATGHAVDPGRHEIVLRRGDERADVVVVVAERDRTEIDFAKLLPLPPATVPSAEATPVAAPEPSATRRTRDPIDLRRERAESRRGPFFQVRRDRERRPDLGRRRLDP